MFAFKIWILLLCLYAATEGKARGKKKKKGTQFEKWPLPKGSCPVGSKMDPATEVCKSVRNVDVIEGLKWLTQVSKDKDKDCQKSFHTQGFVVCEDELTYSDTSDLHALNDKSLLLLSKKPADQDAERISTKSTCVVWSIVATKTCDDLGTMGFERQMAAKGCQVELYQYLIDKKGERCTPRPGKQETEALEYWGEFKHNIRIHRINVWAQRCYACVYKEVMRHMESLESTQDTQDSSTSAGTASKSNRPTGFVDILKVQSRHASNGEGSSAYEDDYDGIQYVPYHTHMLTSMFSILYF